METFHITFGQRYRREAHPTLGALGHPDYVIEIRAQDRAEAEAIAAAITTPRPGDTAQYAFLYEGPLYESGNRHLFEGTSALAEIATDAMGEVLLTAYRPLRFAMPARREVPA